MKKALLLAILISATALIGCGGGEESTDKELKGKVESTEIQSAPGDQRPGGGEREGN